MSLSDDKLRDEIEDITTTTFSILGVPIKTFKRFLRFCEENAQITKIFKDRTGQKQIRKELCYSIGLAILLDSFETDSKHQLLFDRLVKVENAVFKNGYKTT